MAAKYENEPQSLGEVIDRLDEAAQREQAVSLEVMMQAVGRRSFGPIVLLVGVIAMSPLSGIPTLPSLLGVLVVLVAGQLVIGRKRFWIPSGLLERSISSKKVEKGLNAVRPIGRFVDRFLKPRLTVFTKGIGSYVMAVFCVLVGATMPPLEVLPFLATSAGLVLTSFGLAIISQDGVLALFAMGGTSLIGFLAVKALLF
ncbi:exopolysaccharide biosynthesis protein [Pelagicoccus sp. NFK12]|uniref:Exopolysaccharide biosynthesis protein n=1 Tax=Pelagicoccus enzymogenes TaxID=2773457 RepID=A0A927FAY2_9BACT|nr:exopolysaccharide biosynthesis protein [Pelagicoccus enzymogenes]MBD5780108.1 exopolysaccharide biosynthesis protein [Pelagicoccus enzymogenes]